MLITRERTIAAFGAILTLIATAACGSSSDKSGTKEPVGHDHIICYDNRGEKIFEKHNVLVMSGEGTWKIDDGTPGYIYIKAPVCVGFIRHPAESIPDTQ